MRVASEQKVEGRISPRVERGTNTVEDGGLPSGPSGVDATTREAGRVPSLTWVAVGTALAILIATAIGVTLGSIGGASHQSAIAPSVLDERADYGLRHPGVVHTRTGFFDMSADHGLRHPRLVPLRSASASPRLQRAVSWLEGLAGGIILPSDVTGRLHEQAPNLARLVMAAWQDLQDSRTNR